MSTRNPLLIAIKESPNFGPVKCERVYTSISKTGVCRVKFYKTLEHYRGMAFPNVYALIDRLRRLGWKEVYAKNTYGPSPYGGHRICTGFAVYGNLRSKK